MPNDAMGSFKPNKDRTEDWHAPFKGHIDVPVTDQLRTDLATGHLSFWVDVVPNGQGDDKWYSLRLNRREYRPKEQQPASTGFVGPDDEIPF